MAYPIFSRMPFPSAVAAVMTAIVLVAAGPPALAQVKGQTEPDQDPRRVRSGAKITAETNPDDRTPKEDSDRLHDAYQPKGIDLGEFLLLPKLELDEIYNTNLYAAESDKKADLVTVARPEIKLRSRFREHAINLGFTAEQYLHRRYNNDNRLEAALAADGRYDFSSETQGTGYTELFSRHEDRGSPDDARGLKPTPTSGMTNRYGVKHQFGSYTVSGEVGLDRRQFEDVTTAIGTTVPNHDRDRWEYLAKTRGSYEIFAGYAAVAEVSANARRYDDARDRNGYARDSEGYRVEAGVGLDITELIRGDFLVGYFGQDYEDRRFQDPSGLTFRATFNWTPDKITIVVPSLERSVAETTSVGASSMVRTAGTVTVRHELERNILLTGFAGVFHDEMEGIDQSNWTYELRGRTIYALSPELFIGGEVAQKIKRSDTPGSGFNQTLFLARLGLQM